MTSLSFEPVSGQSEMLAAFQAAPGKLRAIARQGAENAAGRAISIAQAAAPVLTGTLRSSVREEAGPDGGSTVEVDVVAGGPPVESYLEETHHHYNVYAEVQQLRGPGAGYIDAGGDAATASLNDELFAAGDAAGLLVEG